MFPSRKKIDYGRGIYYNVIYTDTGGFFMPQKPVLRFRKDGRFRILMVSDFHSQRRPSLAEDYNYKLVEGLRALIEDTHPDMVIVGGDQCIDAKSIEECKGIMEMLLEPVSAENIPWAAVFGNHDNETGLPVSEEEKAYEMIAGCLNEAGPSHLDGTANFVLPVLASDSDKVAFNLFCLDSHRNIEDLAEKFSLPEDTKFILPRHFNDGQNGCSPTFEQVMWYYNTSKQAEADNGRKIPAAMFMHIPLPEYLNIVRNPEHCNAIGSKRETIGCCELNFGMFAACLQRGDVKGIFFGHEHLCDIQGEYCGITMAQDAALGYNMSAHDDLRGGRVIDLYEDGCIETKAVKLIDLLGEKAMRRPGYFEGGCKYFIRDL